jgi:hypothetical protein
MSVLWKVLGMTVAGVLVIALYISGSAFGAFFGSHNPMGFLIYVGLFLTAAWLIIIMFLASTGGGEAEG